MSLTRYKLYLARKEIRSLNRENKYLHILGVVIFILFAGTNVFHILNMGAALKENQKLISFINNGPSVQDTKLYFEDLNNFEEQSSRELIKRVNPIYLKMQAEIHIVKNVSSHCSKGIDCAGVNFQPNGIIYVEYTSDEAVMRTRLCHELLHTMIYPARSESREDPLHAIVYDLGEKQPCFS